MLRSFLRSRSGNFAVMFAGTLPVLLLAVGLAVDFVNLLNVKSRLQSAADAGVLAAAKEGVSASEREALFESFLTGNFNVGNASVKTALLETEPGANYLRLNAHVTADVDLFVLDRLGSQQVSVLSSTYRSAKSMEIAIVLDNTGSMGAGGINALKRASHALVDTVDNARIDNQDVRISLVPFVTAVNIKGEGFDENWIDRDGKALYNGWNFLDDELRQRRSAGERLDELPSAGGNNNSGNGGGGGRACNNRGQGAPAIEMRERCRMADQYPHHMHLFEQVNVEWKGCVEARPYPHNFTMTPPDPSNPDTLFVPYFAPDEPDVPEGEPRMMTGGNSGTGFNNSWLEDQVSGSQAERQRSTLKYIDPPAMSVSESGPLTIGPNRACATPIVPLTTEFSKVRAGIDAMNYWNGSGTNIAEGLAWGWRVLSPEAPYTQAGAFDPERRQKFMVLMTDGRNVSFGASNTINRSDYGAYNFLANGLIGGTTNQGTAERTLNDWTLDMCGTMKSQDIVIFTVVYNERDAGVHTLFRNCASQPENFYMADNTAALEAAFASIGSQMSRLRLTQ